jgi:hypothetical protein
VLCGAISLTATNSDPPGCLGGGVESISGDVVDFQCTVFVLCPHLSVGSAPTWLAAPWPAGWSLRSPSNSRSADTAGSVECRAEKAVKGSSERRHHRAVNEQHAAPSARGFATMGAWASARTTGCCWYVALPSPPSVRHCALPAASRYCPLPAVSRRSPVTVRYPRCQGGREGGREGGWRRGKESLEGPT